VPAQEQAESAEPAGSAIAPEVRLSAIARADPAALGIVEEVAASEAEQIALAAVTFPEVEPATGVPSAEATEATEDSADEAQPATVAVALRVSDHPAAAGAVRGAVAVGGGVDRSSKLEESI
jgi:hypothetical protein